MAYIMEVLSNSTQGGRPKPDSYPDKDSMQITALGSKYAKVQVINADGGNHSHLEIWYNGKFLGYGHIMSDRVYWFSVEK